MKSRSDAFLSLRPEITNVPLNSVSLQEEYKIYIQNSSALNKRIMSMLMLRYQSQIQLFETPQFNSIYKVLKYFYQKNQTIDCPFKSVVSISLIRSKKGLA